MGTLQQKHCGFTLLELLVVIAVLGLLIAVTTPMLARGVNASKATACRSNLRQLYVAYRLYLDDHDEQLFPWREEIAAGTLWYFGLEPRSSSGAREGTRKLDKSYARLAPYLAQIGGVEICPSFPYGASYTKRKFEIASYGYGLNEYLIAGTPANRRAGLRRFSEIQYPSRTIVWADSAQVNTWQAPASPSNPMLEEWYYLSSSLPASFHFRHERHCQAIMADGSIRMFAPAWLDARCDGLTGLVEPIGQDYWLRPRK